MLDQMSNIICDNMLLDLSEYSEIDDVQNLFSQFIQQREYEIFLANNFNLRSFTVADVLKLLIKTDASICNTHITKILDHTYKLIFEKDELCLQLITSFSQVPMFLAVTLIVSNQLQLSSVSQHLLGLVVHR